MAALAIALLGAGVVAQITDRQERAGLKFDELHGRMQELEILLGESEPDESRVLRLGNRFIQEKEIREHMTAVKTLLEDRTSQTYKLAPYPPLPPQGGENTRQRVLNASRERFTRPRSQIDEKLRRFLAPQA